MDNDTIDAKIRKARAGSKQPKLNLYDLQREPKRGYDCVHGMVICAANPRDARTFASNSHMDEGSDVWMRSREQADGEQSYSTCTLLATNAKCARAGVVMRDINNG